MRLKELRESKGMTQQEISLLIGYSTGAYGRYERGDRKPDIDMLKFLSKYYGVSIDYIVCND